MTKYNNRKVVIDGITFDSQKEGNFYCELKVLKMAGEVKEFSLQVPYELQPKFKCAGKTIRAIKYVADFVVTYADGSTAVIDTKRLQDKGVPAEKEDTAVPLSGYKF